MVNIRRFLSAAVILLLLLALAPLALAQGGSPVQVSLVDGQIKMANSLPSGSTTFMVTNNGTHEHSFEIEGNGVSEELEPYLQPGQNGTLTVNLPAGTYEVYCPVDGHRAAGMTMQLTVTAAAQTTPGTTAAPGTAQTAPGTTAAPGTAQQTGQQSALLPTTGEVLSPWSGTLLLGFGLLILLIGGLSLALTRRIL